MTVLTQLFFFSPIKRLRHKATAATGSDLSHNHVLDIPPPQGIDGWLRLFILGIENSSQEPLEPLASSLWSVSAQFAVGGIEISFDSNHFSIDYVFCS
jgi:hypothetical protein